MAFVWLKTQNTGFISEKKDEEEDEYDESRRKAVRSSTNVDSDSD